MAYENILFAIEGGAARLTLNRPDKLNSFTAAMHEEVRDAIARVRADKSMRVLVITGAGRAFCAGQDLSDRKPTPGAKRDLGESVDKDYNPLVLSLKSLPIPVVCGVNGVAAGAGVNLALACDIVVAARSAKFVEAFCKLGLIPDTGGTYHLPRLVGAARAMGLAMLGESLPAETAAQWGLIWKCVEDAHFAAEIDGLARHLACAPTRGLAAAKRAILASPHNTLAQQLDLERDLMREMGGTSDYAEGVSAFLEKRPARFTGE